MKWRGIDEEDVRHVLNTQGKIEESIKGRKHVRAFVGKRLIQVTFKEERDRIVIVTVIDKTR